MDPNFLDRTIQTLGERKDALIPLLQAIQAEYRYLPQDALRYICRQTEITAADILGVASFYDQFRYEPVGEHIISVCTGTACHVKGATHVYDGFRNHLGLCGCEDTDAKGQFTVQKIACLGCCTLAPVVQIDRVSYGHLTAQQVGDVIDDFLHRGNTAKNGAALSMKTGRADMNIGEVRIGLGSCCQAQGSAAVRDEIQRVLRLSGQSVSIKPVGCVGMCHQTPLLETVSTNGVSKFYAKVRPEDVQAILFRDFKPASWKKRTMLKIENWLARFWSDEFGDPTEQCRIELDQDPVRSFLEPQVNVAMGTCGRVNPTDLDEYKEIGGFAALKRAVLEMNSEEILRELEISALRGRGGAGFPTFQKWKLVHDAAKEHNGEQKYVVCNGDEGDPGAFMDRMLLESYPLRILEGMTIAAKTVGATQGYLYIRAEYPLAVQRVREAIAACERNGFLGQNILGTDFSFDLKVKEGAGAFVCGEETALLESIEGKRGMPRLRPPYPVHKGLWDKPTLVNNVETFSLVSWILQNGGAKFAELGVKQSTGPKVFALAGKVRRGGLIEIPMGITIREVVEKIGGGIQSDGTTDEKHFKAVQIGGPSGGCIPAKFADTPIDYESLTAVGAIMGSGGLVVLDEDDCMVDIARYFLQFTQEQSCGKCTFCRVGTRRMLDILNRICEGKGKADDLQNLETLAVQVKTGSLCGLGKTAPNPVLSTLLYFRDEYEAHLDGRCPAGKCRSLIEYRINDRCNGCSICSGQCPVGAIPAVPYRRHVVNTEICSKCNVCRTACPHGAVDVVKNGG